MAYRALYRVWRPQKFGDIVGQEHVTRTLQNAIREQRFSHAYLFSGPRGTGKTSAAKIMAKAVNCENGPAEEPCNQCDACKGITDGSVVDVVEIDAASNRGIDEIRDLRDKVKYAPSQVKFKIYIIDEVHMLTTEAFNALLKTLEEPPAHILFILATTEPHKLPATIVSRCQRFDFHRIGSAAIVSRLSEVIQSEDLHVSEQALTFIARLSEGGMRDALSLLDQALSFGGKRVELEDVLSITGAVSHELLAEAARYVRDGSAAEVVDVVHKLVQRGKSPEQFLDDLLFYFRDLLLYQTAPGLEEIQDRIAIDPAFKELGDSYQRERLFTIVEQLNRSQNEIKWANHPRVLLELVLIQLCQTEDAADGFRPSSAPDAARSIESPAVDAGTLEQLVQRIQSLENHIKKIETREPTTETHSSTAAKKREPKKLQSTVKIPTARIREIAVQSYPKQVSKLVSIWPDVLSRVKQRSVSLSAWLQDGHPVALSDDGLVLGFKTVIHCETTAREDNKKLIEEVIKGVINRPVELYTLMENQWREISGSVTPSTEQEVSEEKKEEPSSDPLIEEALKLVGEDLVRIID
ncbi:DNA polymerase III subunit gamma/tau [Aneurinibacillus sp. Ricciae_BoGa-3]|uniref:DNA polymerase III subunit gamma/tau n=1 Tax=Aneurinibacillus sp. Ricciae_BoGa-3 TaxID=3022697 RepID=UPI0023405808|nr:DNA polymerase III subunit gamma/tau [Aneurinibacillus sp. Ricciae_BoGa-3]WCK54602.1 DNA polymerase III subunit gamma/tau [Aneurinibacillus sp. Ricciae_BoGa-3]